MRAPLNQSAARLRLFHMREQAEAVGVTMGQESERFALLRGDDAKPRAVSAFNLFQTPEHLADRMAEMLGGLGDGARVLEPSAGLGRLYSAVRRRCGSCRVDLVEQSSDCGAELYRLTSGDDSARLLVRDYLAWPGESYTHVIMNPPFKRGADIRHIEHARGMLRPGGVLVSLCYDGKKQGQKLRPQCDTWEPLPAGTFKESGTAADVVLLTMTH